MSRRRGVRAPTRRGGVLLERVIVALVDDGVIDLEMFHALQAELDDLTGRPPPSVEDLARICPACGARLVLKRGAGLVRAPHAPERALSAAVSAGDAAGRHEEAELLGDAQIAARTPT